MSGTSALLRADVFDAVMLVPAGLAQTRSSRSPRFVCIPLTPGAQYCTGIGRRKVHHLPCG